MTVHPAEDLLREYGLLDALLAAPTLTRRLYRRGGFEGLEPNALQVLLLLHRIPDLTVNEVVEQLALGQGTVSTALGRLAARDLVTAKTDKTDRRRQRQSLTRDGQSLARRFIRSVDGG